MKLSAMFFRQLIAFLICVSTLTAAHAKDDGTDKSITIEKETQTFFVNLDGSFTATLEYVILINEERAIKKAAQRSLSYDSDRQTLKVLEAYTQKPDERRIMVAADKILDQQTASSANAPMFQDSRTKVVIFPDVAVGDRLVLRFQRTESKPLFAGQFLDNSFPSFANIKQFTLTYDMPAEMPLYADDRGFTLSFPNPTTGRKIYRWDYIPVENARVEHGSVGWHEYRGQLIVSTLPDLSALAKAYGSGANGKSEVTPKIAELAHRITNNLSSPRDQIYAVNNWVRKNIRYVNVSVGPGGVIPHSADNILESSYGDSKDLASLMEALLNALHIDSTPALINSSTLYTLPKVPSIDALFHVITYIPSLDLYVDSSAASIGQGYLPPNELDKPVLLIKSGKISHTPKFQKDKVDVATTFKIAADGSANFTHRTQFYGVSADMMRYVNRQLKQADIDNSVERILQARGQKGKGTFDIGDINAVNDEYKETLAGSVENFVELPGPSGFVPTSFISSVANVIYSLTAEKERTQPFICAQFDVNEQVRLEFPQEIDLITIPKPLILHDVNFDYSSQYVREENTLVVTRHIVEHHDGRVCSSSDYKKMQPVIEQMVRDVQSQVIIQGS